jgi:hypothetical protein
MQSFTVSSVGTSKGVFTLENGAAIATSSAVLHLLSHNFPDWQRMKEIKRERIWIQ